MDLSSLHSLIQCVFPSFTDRALDVLSAAGQHAAAEDHAHVTPEHVLLAIAKKEPGVAYIALGHLGVDLRNEIPQIEALVLSAATKPPVGHSPSFSRETESLLDGAKSLSKSMGHNYVGTEHLILGLLYCRQSPASDYLQKGGLTAAQVRVEVLRVLAHAYA